MSPSPKPYDVAIIGSGISGSTLGALLARQGLRVVIFEGGSHPKFAVGESMILETSETLRALAELFEVPELAYFSSENYFDHIGTSHGVKRHFSYQLHEAGHEHDPAHVLQAVIPKQPHGHELHLFRQDSDYFLTAVAVQYGATVLQNTLVADIELRADGVTVVTKQGERYDAAYVVDAGGFRSLLADKFGWRMRELQTHSRTIFTHMVDVPCFNSVATPRDEYGIPFSLSEGTLHHVFEGGWLWVIPFNNHVRSTNPMVSVGLQLDPRLYPIDESLTPEEEFWRFIERFPSIHAQLRDAKAVRGWTRTGRLQYGSTQVVGERFCLLGHAAGFIDPLYSKGLYTTLMSVAVLGHLLLEAQRTGDFSEAHFAPLERMSRAFNRSNDRLVANSFKSWSNPKLWGAYSLLWLLGAYLEYLYLLSARGQARDRADYFRRVSGLKLVGGGFHEFDQIADQVDTIVEAVDPHDEAAVDRAVAEIRALYDGGSLDAARLPAVVGGQEPPARAKVPAQPVQQGDRLYGERRLPSALFRQAQHVGACLLRRARHDSLLHPAPEAAKAAGLFAPDGGGAALTMDATERTDSTWLIKNTTQS